MNGVCRGPGQRAGVGWDPGYHQEPSADGRRLPRSRWHSAHKGRLASRESGPD